MINRYNTIDVYQRPYDPLVPVVPVDEARGRLIKLTRIPRSPGQPETADQEYERTGAADFLMIAERPGAERETAVTETRTGADRADVLNRAWDVTYPRAWKIGPLTGNLSARTSASLYKAFPPEEARGNADRLKRRFTPKHAGWLDMAEIETGIMSGRALAEPPPDTERPESQVERWT
jgi:hypothetical protein